MSAFELADRAREALLLAALLSAPFVAVAFVVGLVVSMAQGATQAHDPAVAHLPRWVAVSASLVALGPWVAGALVEWTRHVLEAAAR